MAHITAQEAQQWLESTKLSVTSLDSELETSASTSVLAQLAAQIDVSSWADQSSTPEMVMQIISMYYVSMYIDRTYSGSSVSLSQYAQLLRQRADLLIAGILTGSYILTDDPGAQVDADAPVFYPTDASSAMCPEDTDYTDFSVGPAKFSMGTVF
jgi:hypothetical protein